jgi:hypothetical protein
VIRLDLLSVLEHRDVALRAVAVACKQVAARPEGRAFIDFRIQVISAVGEAFNNIVLHGYSRRRDGIIKLRIRPRPGEIRVEMRDWGESFDPKAVPVPDLATLPESGLGLYIIHSFMEVSYIPGRPNILILYKKLDESPDREATQDAADNADPVRRPKGRA